MTGGHVQLGADYTPEAAFTRLSEVIRSEGRRFGTGYQDIDSKCGQMGPGELALIWARAGAGKSTLACNILARTPQIPTLVVSIEMPVHRLAAWLLTMSYDLSFPANRLDDAIRGGHGTPERDEYERAAAAAAARYERFELWHPKTPQVPDIIVRADLMAERTGRYPQRVVIDHLTRIDGAWDYVGILRTCAALQEWATDRGVLVVALQQTGRTGDGLNRNDGGIPVTLSSGLYGGEHEADWVFGLYRPERHPKYRKPRDEFRTHQEWAQVQAELSELKNISVLQVVKNRPYGTLCEDGVRLRFDPWTRRLEEAARDEE